MPTIGILHGLNAFLLIWLAVMAVRAVSDTAERIDSGANSRAHVRAH